MSDDPPIIAVGIDFAVQPSNTGVCVLKTDSDGQPFAYFDKRRDDDGLTSLIIEARKAKAHVAIDVPLGWSKEFSKFLEAPDIDAAAELLRAGEEAEKNYRFINLRLRPADRELRDHLREHGRPTGWTGNVPYPLSASTDKLGAATMRWYAIRAKLRHQPGGLAAANHVIETYPAAARYTWKWPVRKEPPWSSVQDLIRPESWPANGRRREPNEHEWDALVACLVANLEKDDRHEFTGEEHPGGRSSIWIPKVCGDPLSILDR